MFDKEGSHSGSGSKIQTSKNMRQKRTLWEFDCGQGKGDVHGPGEFGGFQEQIWLNFASKVSETWTGGKKGESIPGS